MRFSNDRPVVHFLENNPDLSIGWREEISIAGAGIFRSL